MFPEFLYAYAVVARTLFVQKKINRGCVILAELFYLIGIRLTVY